MKIRPLGHGPSPFWNSLNRKLLPPGKMRPALEVAQRRRFSELLVHDTARQQKNSERSLGITTLSAHCPQRHQTLTLADRELKPNKTKQNKTLLCLSAPHCCACPPLRRNPTTTCDFQIGDYDFGSCTASWGFEVLRFPKFENPRRCATSKVRPGLSQQSLLH